MQPHQHASSNAVLAPPPGMSAEECQPLAITRIKFGAGGLDGVVSFWRPTEADLQLLNAGRSVRISFVGVTHPPVYVGVDGDGLMELSV